MTNDGELAAGPVPFEYAVLRVVPRVDRGEYVNVAVVLYCQRLQFLRCASDLDPQRLRALHPGLNLETVTAALDGVRAVCDGDSTAGQASAQPLRARFGWLTAPRSTVLQPGAVHSGLTADPEAELDKLLGQLVRLQPRSL